MRTDLTLKVTPQTIKDAQGNEKKALSGHLGTHFDVMDKEFPLDYLQRKGICFDVSKIIDREIETEDIALHKVEEGMFVAFYSGFIEKEGYGTPVYFHEHPQLSKKLIEELVSRKIAIIGIDFAGVRRGKEHTPTDQYCADHDVFIVENLCSLKQITGQKDLKINTYPLNYAGMSGLPCRVVAEYDEP